jgi:hypothetical protein
MCRKGRHRSENLARQKRKRWNTKYERREYPMFQRRLRIAGTQSLLRSRQFTCQAFRPLTISQRRDGWADPAHVLGSSSGSVRRVIGVVDHILVFVLER